MIFCFLGSQRFTSSIAIQKFAREKHAQAITFVGAIFWLK
jgi:hypothetical protein